MSTGAKIAIGCVVAAVLGGVVVASLVFGGLWWAKGKVEQVTGNETRIQDLKKKANAVPFTQPADGVIQEDRLVKFLDIRKRVFAVYEQHRAEIEAMGKKKQADLGDVTRSIGVLNEVRNAQAQALADVGMSEDEYRFMVTQIYKTMYANEVAKQTGGKSVSEAAGAAYDTAAQSMDQARQAAEEAHTQSKQDEANANLTPEQRKMLADQREAARKTMDDLKKGTSDLDKQAAEARESAKQLDAPPQNIALFRKYEPEIKKYAMGGLEWLGL
jgi:hypothetical protein